MLVRSLARCLLAALIVSTSGCAKAELDARRDHILAADHGWIDLTLKAPSAQLPDAEHTSCSIAFGFHGESLLDASADLKQAQANKILVGYRFPAPSGSLQTELHISGCVKAPLVLKLPLELKKDYLVELAFDGSAVNVKRDVPYDPTSLEWVRSQILQMQAESNAAYAAMSTLTKIALASLALNFLMLLLMLWSRRSKAR